jgi:hypothetical protein
VKRHEDLLAGVALPRAVTHTRARRLRNRFHSAPIYRIAGAESTGIPHTRWKASRAVLAIPALFLSLFVPATAAHAATNSISIDVAHPTGVVQPNTTGQMTECASDEMNGGLEGVEPACPTRGPDYVRVVV